MDKALKQRMVGAVVLIALGVIFIPMLLDGSSREERRTVELDIPEPPERDYRSRLLPLEAGEGQGASTEAGRVQRETRESRSEPPTVQTAGTTESGDEQRSGAGDAESQSPPETQTEPAPSSSPGPANGQETGSATADESSDPEPSRDNQPLGNWFVQVGSFSKQANAGDLRDRLRGAGYSAFVETSTVEGKTTHRVKVGPEMDRARAEETRDEILSEFDLKGIVVSEP